jgi:uncharacterized protein YxeA
MLILFTRNGLTAKILPQSVSMALILCLIICLPVFIVHADIKIARADTKNDISPLLAKRIISVQSEKGENVLKVKIIADGKLKDYKYFRLKMPHRFVIDLNNVKLSVDPKAFLLDSPLVKNIRIGTSYKDKVRIVFDLFPETEFYYKINVFSRGDQLIVAFISASAFSDIESGRNSQPTPGLSATEPVGKDKSTLPQKTTEQAQARPPSAELTREKFRASVISGKIILQVSLIADKVQAEKEVQRLGKFGYDSFFQEIEVLGKKWFRVFIGVFDDVDEALWAGSELKKKGVISNFKIRRID